MELAVSGAALEHFISEAHSIAFFLSFLMLAVALRSLVRSWMDKDFIRRSEHRHTLFVTFVAFLLLFSLQYYSDVMVRLYKHFYLSPLSKLTITSVRLDGQEVANPSQLVDDLKSYYEPIKLERHPACRFALSLGTAEGMAVFYLERDAKNPRHYWVFDPGNAPNQPLCIDHVFTRTLDRYNCPK